MSRTHRLGADRSAGTNDPGNLAQETVGAELVANDKENRADAGQFDAASIGRAWAAPHAPHDQPVTLDHNFIPYRGGVAHGVAIQSPDTDGPTRLGTAGDVMISNILLEDHARPLEDKPSPILVTIEETPKPYIDKRIATNTAIVPTGANAWVPICGKRPNRTKLHLRCVTATLAGTAGRVWIVTQSGASIETGYPLDTGADLDTESTEQLWAVSDPANTASVTIGVIDSYETELPHKEIKA